ncbi:MAG: ankyrin repeat domain-containing protein [Succinivibrionaceae bacterium]|nr:ankyrin repeat domain-containing protein [Succinivibrionaceae bacterium]
MRPLKSLLLTLPAALALLSAPVAAVEGAKFLEELQNAGTPFSEDTEKLILEGIAQGIDLNQKRQNRSLLSFIAQKARTPEPIKAALARGADPNLPGANGLTPFMVAAGLRPVEFVEPFLAAGKADFTRVAKSGENALLMALRNRDADKVLEAMLKARPPKEAVSLKGPDGDSLIFRIRSRQDPFNDFSPENERIIRLIGELGGDLNQQDHEGRTLLQRSLINSRGHLSFSPKNLALLLELGARPGTVDRKGDTALHTLVDHDLREERDLKALEAFLRQGAGEAKDQAGNTALLRMFTTSLSDHNENCLDQALGVFIAQGARLDAVNAAGANVVMAAAASGCSKCVLRLLAANAPVTYKGAPYPPLFYAAQGELSKEALEGLVKAGAGVNDADATGLTPLMVALLSSQGERVVERLIALGANVNLADKSGRTALMAMAAADPRVGIARALLKAGADPAARDAEGRTALDYLERSNYYTHPKYQKICLEIKEYLTGGKQP